MVKYTAERFFEMLRWRKPLGYFTIFIAQHVDIIIVLR